VCIVDEELVHRYWPHTDPTAKRITFNNLTDSSIQWIQVVGVVGHLAHEGLDAQKRVQVYFPLAQNGLPFLGYVVRTTGDPMAALPSVRAAVRSVDPELPLANVNTMEKLIESSTGQRRFAMLLLIGFSLLAMTLASIGLYGVMSYTVSQRSRELGVRLAFAVTRVMKNMLFGLSSTDPLTFVTISLLLVMVALVASYLPALRATRVDPVVALRTE
jgi:hypothetical protein